MKKHFQIFAYLVGDPMIKAASATVGVLAVLIMAKVVPVATKTEK